jgi:hypothetical protein
MRLSTAKLTLSQLEKLYHAKRQQEKASPLIRKRAKLLKAADKLQRKIDRMLDGAAADVSARGPGRPRGAKRQLSAKARKAISDAQRRRWAKYRKAAKA